MKIKFLIATIFCLIGSVSLLHAQEKKVESTLVIHTKNEKSPIENSSTKPMNSQTAEVTKTDKPDFVPLTQHTKNEESAVAKAVRSEAKTPSSLVVKITPENKEEILSKVKLTEHTKNQESEITHRKKD